MNSFCETSDLLVFSHIRWSDAAQRPQHLLSRHAKFRRVYYFEDAITGKSDIPRYHIKETDDHVSVVVPYLPANMSAEETESVMRDLVDELIYEEEMNQITSWYYNPQAYAFSDHLEVTRLIYDCTADFSNDSLEDLLLEKADLVLTSGDSLYEAKKSKHSNIHALLDSSWDAAFKFVANLEKSIPKKKIHFQSPFHFVRPILLTPQMSH